MTPNFEEIQNARSNFLEAFNELDWQRFCACFADNATVFHPDNPETTTLEWLEGRAARATRA